MAHGGMAHAGGMAGRGMGHPGGFGGAGFAATRGGPSGGFAAARGAPRFSGGYPGHGGPGRFAYRHGHGHAHGRFFGPGVGIFAYAGPSCGYGDPYSDYYDYNNCYGYGPDYAAPDYGPYGW